LRGITGMILSDGIEIVDGVFRVVSMPQKSVKWPAVALFIFWGIADLDGTVFRQP
jgi:hypothetical protein